ncbi:hypothetical protein HII31_09085 [Pseudocercospora fuligena]|uniref:Uncharacterized protein n=1 Tax=Pseudocercospora fuligena TaxID=685502 RepID=A0A8H6REI1_9PEZI|nr:hypothetical protein HII31_09085 [Pseudocercospora fuligena]
MKNASRHRDTARINSRIDTTSHSTNTVKSAARSAPSETAMSPTKKNMSPTKRSTSPRKVLFPMKAVPRKPHLKRTITSSPRKNTSSSSPPKKTGANFFSFRTSDDVQVMIIPLIDRSKMIKRPLRIISPEKQPLGDLTRPLEPTKVRKTIGKKLKSAKHAGCTTLLEKKPTRGLAEQLELAKIRLPSCEKVKVVEHASQIVSPEKKAPDDAAKQLKVIETHTAAEKKLRAVKIMVKSWKQHGAVNEKRLKQIMDYIDKVMTDCTEAERSILQGPMRAIFDDLKHFESMLEQEAAEELETVRKTAAKAKAATSEQHDLATNPPRSTTARISTEALSDQESLQILMAVKDHRKSSSPKKPGMLTKKWIFGPVTVSSSSLQSKKNAGNDGPDIEAWIFVLLLVALVLVQIY